MEYFDRIARVLPEHPREAIGAAKELIESTAKVVLVELGEPVDERSDDLPGLISRAQRALHLHPASAASGPDGSDAVKKILGGLTSAAIGVAELRNRGYGTGHGPAQAPVGLRPRHAYLAVGAARTWCQLILDTLADPEAPWQRGKQP
ncbi:abortive infection family protein [Saccharothrix texasensis]|uniref:abortive infection family protein n=1 Tax=Saccharothrix texasensis TaxID=103734 RepID=UPI001FE4FACF|nr:abortive infection family protein [Saccharothrix texasensis]